MVLSGCTKKFCDISSIRAEDITEPIKKFRKCSSTDFSGKFGIAHSRLVYCFANPAPHTMGI